MISATDTGGYFRHMQYAYCGQLKTVPAETPLPNTVTTIGQHFRSQQYSYCGALPAAPAEADMPIGITVIPDSFREGQYRYCTALTGSAPAEKLPERVTAIGSHFRLSQYDNCSRLTTAAAETMPNYVVAIGTDFRAYQYYGCARLTATAAEVMSTGVSTLSDNFRSGQYGSCTSLTAAAAEVMPNNVKYINDMFRQGQYANCTKLTAAAAEVISDKVETIGDNFRVQQYLRSSLTTAPAEALPSSGLISIGNSFRYSQYYYCTSLKTAATETLPIGISSVQDDFRAQQYYYCTSLTAASPEATPDGVTSIGDNFRSFQYYGCTALTTAGTEMLPSSVRTIGNYFRRMQYRGDTMLRAAAAEVLNDGVTSIGDYFRVEEYRGCRMLGIAPNEAMPNTVTSIGTYFRQSQFQECFTLRSAPAEALSNKITAIPDYFRSNQYFACTYLPDSATEALPSGVRTIGNYFRYRQYFVASYMTRINPEVLPDSVESIGSYFRAYQFNYCTMLVNAAPEVLPGNVTQVGDYFRSEQYAVCASMLHAADFLEPATLTAKGANYRYHQYWEVPLVGNIVIQKSGAPAEFAIVGDVLSFDADLLFKFSGKNPPALSGGSDLWKVQWLRDGADIPGAPGTGNTYTVVLADLNTNISVKLTSQVHLADNSENGIYNENGSLVSNDVHVPTYTVTFDPGARGSIGGATTANVVHNSTLTAVPTVTPDSTYVFIGWESGLNGGLYSDASLLTLPIIEDVTFTAMYTPAQNATVLFDYAGGEANGVTSSYQIGPPQTAYRIPAPTRTGYVMTGWNVNPDGIFGAQGSVRSYTAQWRAETFIVTFDQGDHGTLTGNPVTRGAVYGSGLGAPNVPAPTADANYTFVGWTDGTGIYNSTAVAALPIKSPVTFTAKYAPAGNSTVVFDYAGGTEGGAGYKIVSGQPGDPLSPLLPAGLTRTGYLWAGANGGWDVPVPADFPGTAGDVTTYTAQWSVNSIAVFFAKGSNGTITPDPAVVQVGYGGSLGMANIPNISANTNYDFIGWESGTGIFYTSQALAPLPITSSMIFTAIYADAANGTVIFDYSGGTEVGAGYKILSGLPGAPYRTPAPTRPGYKLIGWNRNPTNTFGAAGSRITYVALWTPGVTHDVKINTKLAAAPAALHDTVQYPGGEDVCVYPPYISGYLLTGYIVDGGSETAVSAGLTGALFAAIDADHEVTFVYASESDYISNKFATVTVTGKMNDSGGAALYSYVKSVPKSTTASKVIGDNEVFDLTPTWVLKSGERAKQTFAPAANGMVEFYYESNTTNVTVYAKQFGTSNNVIAPIVMSNVSLGSSFNHGSLSILGYQLVDRATGANTPPYTGTINPVSASANTLTFYYKAAAGNQLVIYKDKETGGEIGRDTLSIPVNTPVLVTVPAIQYYTTTETARNVTWDGLTNIGDVVYEYTRDKAAVRLEAWDSVTNLSIGQSYGVTNKRVLENYDYRGDIPGLTALVTPMGYSPAPHGSTIVNVTSSGNTVKVWYTPAENGTVPVELRLGSASGALIQAYTLPAATGETVTLSVQQIPDLTSLGFAYTNTGSILTATEGGGDAIILVYDDIRRAVTVKNDVDTTEVNENVPDGAARTIFPPYKAGFVATRYSLDGGATKVPIDSSFTGFGATVTNDLEIIFYYDAAYTAEYVTLTVNGMSGTQMLFSYPTLIEKNRNTPVNAPGVPGYSLDRTRGENWSGDGENAGAFGQRVINLSADGSHTFYFTKNTATVKVDVIDQATGVTVAGQSAQSMVGNVGDTITVNAPTIADYELVSGESSSKTHLVINGLNEISFTYKKTSGNILIKAVEQGNTDNILGMWSDTGGIGEVYTAVPRDFAGWIKPGTAAQATVAAGQNIVILEYAKDMLTVTVHYYEKGTTSQVASDSMIQAQLGETLTVTADPADLREGYVIDGPTYLRHMVTTGANELSFTYKKTSGNILIKAVEQGNTDNILGMWSDAAEVGEVYTAAPRDFAGWIAPGTAAQATVAAGQNIVTLEYAKDMRMIVVHYYEKGTTGKVASDTLIQAQLGETLTVTADPADLREGYVIDGSAYLRHMAAAGANEVVFDYTLVVNEKPGERTEVKPGLKILVTVASSGLAQAGAAVKATVNGSTANYTADGTGQVEVPNAVLGAYSVEASYSGYDAAKGTATLTESKPDQTLYLALGKTVSVPPTGGGGSMVVSGGGGGGGDGLTAATLKIRCIDEKGAEIFLQALTTVVGKTETIKAPPIKGYKLAAGEKESQSTAIKSGENVATFKYAVDGAALSALAATATGSAVGAAGDLGASGAISGAAGAGAGNAAGNRVADLLETEDHIKYITGYPDGTVRPESSITRAEAAMIFYRLIKDAGKNAPVGNSFSDVKENAWFAQAVGYLTKNGILKGYNEAGAVNFKPNQSITRAEFAAMAMRFDTGSNVNVNPFSDLTGANWAYNDILSAYGKGWIGGYPDGTVKPGSSITRAEVVTVVNKMLNRRIQKDDVPNELQSVFPDLSAGYWGFTAVTEAAFEHDPKRKDDGYELWSRYVR